MKSGHYTVQAIMDALDFDLSQAEGDNRRVKVGGLSYDFLDQVINIPAAAETIEITLDGNVVASADVEPDDQ